MARQKMQPQIRFPFHKIDRSDLWKVCYGKHPLLASLSQRLDALAEEATRTLEALREEELKAFVALQESIGQGPRWVLTPATQESKYLEEEYEDRDHVRFRLTPASEAPDIKAHKEYYGPVADQRYEGQKMEPDKNYSLTYYRLASGKVKAGGGGWHVLNDPNGSSFTHEYGIWTDAEWQDFKVRGIIPQRFW